MASEKVDDDSPADQDAEDAGGARLPKLAKIGQEDRRAFIQSPFSETYRKSKVERYGYDTQKILTFIRSV